MSEWRGGDDLEDENDEVVEIRTMDTRGAMIRIRAEKKQALARVRELMKRSEDILTFDMEAEEVESESMKKGACNQSSVPLSVTCTQPLLKLAFCETLHFTRLRCLAHVLCDLAFCVTLRLTRL